MIRTHLYRLQGINYKDSLFIQEGLQNKLISGDTDQQFLVYAGYTDHIFTQGKHGQNNNLLIERESLDKLNIKYYETDRGGDITYHGPGQIVIYPIFNLRLMKFGVKKYVNRIELLLMEFMKEYGLNGITYESNPGIWIGEKKIASVGINVKRHITKHGFALNINNDLSYFEYINPCGFESLKVTSLSQEIGEILEMEDCCQRLLSLMEYYFDIEIIEKNFSLVTDNIL